VTILCEYPGCDEVMEDDGTETDAVQVDGAWYCTSHARQESEFCEACGEHEEEHPTETCANFLRVGPF
jgi:hypothetical protein